LSAALADGPLAGGPLALTPGQGLLLHERRWVALVYYALSLVLLALAGLPPARLAATAVLGLAVTGQAFWLVWRAHRGHPPSVVAVIASDFAAVSLAAAFSGGLNSPHIMGMLAPTAAIAAAGRPELMRWFLLATMAMLLGFAGLPGWLIDVHYRGPPWLLVIQTGNVLLTTVYLSRVVITLSEGVTTTRHTINKVRHTAAGEAGRRSRALEAVGTKVAHELKNPLAAIKSLLQLEAGGRRGGEAAGRLELMGRQVSHMEAVLRDYLSFSRPIEGLNLAPLDLRALCDEVAEALEPSTREAQVRLYCSGERMVVRADAHRLKEALLNLTANALEATSPDGQIELKVGHSDGGARLVVRDTGRGMPPAVLARVGTPFFTTRPDGTGLGVVVARTVIEQHRGTLRFDSRSGGGTTVTIDIPVDPTPVTGKKGDDRGQSSAG
jgi:signal transduction histidine kinase